jgi:hypothetical protein
MVDWLSQRGFSKLDQVLPNVKSNCKLYIKKKLRKNAPKQLLYNIVLCGDKIEQIVLSSFSSLRQVAMRFEEFAEENLQFSLPFSLLHPLHTEA